MELKWIHTNSLFGVSSSTDFLSLLFLVFPLVDLFHPLLVGILSDKEEECDSEQVKRRRVFLCLKQGLMLEVDMQRGKERCRLELDSLTRVETTEASWMRAVRRGSMGGERRIKEKMNHLWALIKTNNVNSQKSLLCFILGWILKDIF